MDETLYWDEEEIMGTTSKKQSSKKSSSSNKIAKKGSSKPVKKPASKSIQKSKPEKSKSKVVTKQKVLAQKEKGKKATKGETKKVETTKTARSTTSKQAKPSSSGKTSKEKKQDLPVEEKRSAHTYDDPDWEGNEDDVGSVASGVLEEDYCFVCGDSTLNSTQWNDVILCDICDGEYHLKCVGLKKLPSDSFVCYKCKEEEQQKSLTFNVSDNFALPKKKKSEEHTVVYSPSRPLEKAWHECVTKGLMIVSEVFDYKTMKVLTHGTVERRTSSGRISDAWQGATIEIANRMAASACHNLVDREGRYDLKLPDFVVEELKLEEKLQPILTKLKTIMGNPTPQIRTHNVVFVPVGCHSQQWHADDCMKKRKQPRYFTILIHLNSLDIGCGGTEVWSDKYKRGDLVRGRPGDALVFDGSLLHRGQANLGNTHRFFYYCSFSCGVDMNVGMMQ